MLDTAATCSCIMTDLASRISAKIKYLSIKLGTFGGESTSIREVASFQVKNLLETVELEVNNALVSDILSTESECPPRNSMTSRFPHLSDVVFDELEDNSVGLILDAKFAWTWMSREYRMGAKEDPIAILTHFGWSLIGPTSEKIGDKDIAKSHELYVKKSI